VVSGKVLAREIKKKMIAKHERLIAMPQRTGADPWPAGAFTALLLRRTANSLYELTERVPNGPRSR